MKLDGTIIAKGNELREKYEWVSPRIEAINEEQKDKAVILGENYVSLRYEGYRGREYTAVYWTPEMNGEEFDLENVRNLVSAGLSYIDIIGNFDYDEHIKNEEEAKKEIKNIQEEILEIKEKHGDHFWLFNDHDTAGIEMVLEYKN